MNRRGLVVWWSAWLLTGCPSDPTPGHDCVGEPDFFLTIKSETGALPWDLRLEVEYGAGSESFTFLPGAKPQIVFCSAVPAELGQGGAASGASAGDATTEAGEGGATAGGGGSASSGARHGSLECELYTEGPATIELMALGFETVERDLKLDAEQCTTNVELELELEEVAP